MHDPAVVRRRQAVGDLRDDPDRLIQRHRRLRRHGAEVLPLDQLHRDVRQLALDADVVDRDDVRMIQRRGGARFLLEAAEVFGARRQIG